MGCGLESKRQGNDVVYEYAKLRLGDTTTHIMGRAWSQDALSSDEAQNRFKRCLLVLTSFTRTVAHRLVVSTNDVLQKIAQVGPGEYHKPAQGGTRYKSQHKPVRVVGKSRGKPTPRVSVDATASIRV